MKKKKKIAKRFIFILLLILIIVFIAGFYVTNYIKESKDSYVKVIKDTALYNEKGNEIGNIDKGIILNVIITEDKLYNIKNTDFYISNNSVKENNYKKDDKYSNYSDLGKEITTNKNSTLLFNDKSIKLDKSTKFKVKYMDDEYYYIDLSNVYFKINKDDVSDVKDYSTHSNDSDHVSIINFSNISEQCSNYECYTVDKVKEFLNYLNKSDYYTIGIDDFINWNFGNVKLKDKAVLLMSAESSDLVNGINKEYNNMINVYNSQTGFSYLHNNSTNKGNVNLSALNDYNVRSVTSLDDLKQMLEGKDVVDKFFDGETASSVPVINYHFFYDLSKGQSNCQESICLDVVKFRQQLDYLRDNGYTTLTMDQFVKWIYGEIDVPKKSVLLTIDDGAFGTGFHNGNNLIPILEEYKMHATLFLITGWWGINNYKSNYLEIQSHTHDMHKKISCGAQLICADYQEIMDDLYLSASTIGNTNSFCYPFYEYDDEAIKALKDSNFKVAFAGGSTNATRNSNKYKIPRYPIQSDITLNEFISMVS